MQRRNHVFHQVRDVGKLVEAQGGRAPLERVQPARQVLEGARRQRRPLSFLQLQQIAGFQVPEARLLVITPYDKNSLKAIEKAIQNSDLGVNPSSDETAPATPACAAAEPGVAAGTGAAATTPVTTGAAAVEPPLPVAVTTSEIVAPMSSGVRVYVAVVAPTIAKHWPPVALQRRH